ncbi:conserved hypothetical protein [Mesorhizobium sp. ORS 3359]|nr:conserved hypothetical protein [Mesorhizobium sp. ORS 3359]
MLGDWPEGEVADGLHAFVIHGRGKERSDGADPRVHAVTFVGERSRAEFWSAATPRRHGMDPRVSATELRSCSALG